MIPVFLLTAAIGVIAFILIMIFWRFADRRVKLAYPDEAVNVLQRQLEQALEEQRQLKERVEHLEAIVASDDWDALHDGSDDDVASGAAKSRHRSGRQRSP